ncbi:Hydrocephalus-inducing protein [Ceratobasidium sp. AG-Ba]|nr:Hydrocephalus-inducing protein [Ceratobasidium sp. AG-Ba]
MDRFGVPVILRSATHPKRFGDILNGITRTKSMMVLYGDATGGGQGLPSIDEMVVVSYGPQESRRMTLRALIQDLKPTQQRPAADHNPYVLASLNKIMAERRIAARSSQQGALLDLLSRINDSGRLSSAISTAFDAADDSASPDLRQKTVMVFGDNRRLKCCGPRCPGLDEAATSRLDLVFSNLDDVTGKRRKCPVCYPKFIKDSKKKRHGNEHTYSLRPAVDLDLADSIVAGEDRADLLEAAKSCQLLLIVGATLKSPLLRELVQDLSDYLHQNYGAVVYIHPEELKGRNLYNCIDFHLGLHVEEAVKLIEEGLEQSGSTGEVGEEPVHDEHDLWTDMIGNEVAVEQRGEEILGTGPICMLCGCGIEEYLAGCHGCGMRYCYRRINYDESEEAQAGMDPLLPLDAPDPKADDQYLNEDACLTFNQFTADGRRPRLQQALDDFRCPKCWPRASGTLYPHFIKPANRTETGMDGPAAPSLAVVIFYVEQFWPHVLHLTTLIAGRSANKAWRPVKLEEMDEKRVFHTLPYEPDAYHLVVIYLTHGLTEAQGYQLAHGRSLRPAEFFERTTALVKSVVDNATTCRAFILCCGHPLKRPSLVEALQQWLDSEQRFDYMLGCYNTRLAPAFVVNLAAKLSTTVMDSLLHGGVEAFRAWVTDSLAFSHSDLIFLAPNIKPELWFYAPMQSRPLGKPLPDLLAVCSCPNGPLEGRSVRRGSRKVWDVRYEGAVDRAKLRDVRVNARCSVCRQQWPLPSEHLSGVLRQYMSSYVAVVPYFFEEPESK